MSDLPSITETIRKYGLSTKKSLGQHFLVDTILLDRIVSYAGNLEDYTVIEIGPGPGGLTRSILKRNPKKLIVIEQDQRCITALEALNDAAGSGRMEILHADALQVDMEALAEKRKVKIISNLPYNVGTALLLKWLDTPECIESMTLMFQKEVVNRIASEPGSKAFGRLSVLTQWLCDVKKQCDIAPGAFLPPPKVVSSVITIVPRKTPRHPANRKYLESVCKKSFGQRRKTLRASLKGLFKNPLKTLEAVQIDSSERPEQLTIAQFCLLAGLLEQETESQ